MRKDRRSTLWGLLAITAGVSGADAVGAVEAGPRTALLILDMQRDFLRADGRYPVTQDQALQAISTVNRLIGAAPQLHWPVIAIANAYAWWDFNNLTRNFSAIAGSPGAGLDPRVQLGGAPIFQKQAPDAFSNPRLLKHLRSLEAGHVIIAGVYAEACVTATAKGALRNGLTPVVVADGVASASSAARDRALAALKASGVTLVSSGGVGVRQANGP